MDHDGVYGFAIFERPGTLDPGTSGLGRIHYIFCRHFDSMGPDAAADPETENTAADFAAPIKKRTSRRLRDGLVFLRVSVLGATPCMAVISFIFHVCLLITPFLVTAHNVLLDTAFGMSFVSASERITDALTLIVLSLRCFFSVAPGSLVRRVRAITGPADFMLLAVATTPFLTGFLAYHHIGIISTW